MDPAKDTTGEPAMGGKREGEDGGGGCEGGFNREYGFSAGQRGTVAIFSYFHMTERMAEEP